PRATATPRSLIRPCSRRSRSSSACCRMVCTLRKFSRPDSCHQHHLPAAPQQVSQATLVHGLEKLAIDTPAMAHQETGKVYSQHHGGLLERPPGLTALDRDLRSAEGPHPPQPPAH